MVGRMRIPACLALLIGAASVATPPFVVSPAQAQTEPFRIVNGTTVPATALHMARPGQAEWGANLLNRGPLAPGRFLSLRLGAGSGCRFDIRLVLQDGQEVVRRDADICIERSLAMALGQPPTTSPDAPLPQVGGPDRVLPSIQGTPR